MLVHRLQRWLNFNPTLDQRLAGYLPKNISPRLVKFWAGIGDIGTALSCVIIMSDTFIQIGNGQNVSWYKSLYLRGINSIGIVSHRHTM